MLDLFFNSRKYTTLFHKLFLFLSVGLETGGQLRMGEGTINPVTHISYPTKSLRLTLQSKVEEIINLVVENAC